MESFGKLQVCSNAVGQVSDYRTKCVSVGYVTCTTSARTNQPQQCTLHNIRGEAPNFTASSIATISTSCFEHLIPQTCDEVRSTYINALLRSGSYHLLLHSAANDMESHRDYDSLSSLSLLCEI